MIPKVLALSGLGRLSKQENKKVLLLCLLRFLLFYVYGILTILKSTTLVMASHSAAEVVFVVKGAVVVPVFIACFIVYAKLSRHFKQSTIFYGTVCCFLGFFWLYGFVLYPNEEKISPCLLADTLAAYVGSNHMHWIALLRYWIHGLFFVVAELWGQVVVTILYWNLANSLCTVVQAKRFYASLIASGHIGLCLSSLSVLYYTKNHGTALLVVLQALFRQIVVFGLVSIVLYGLVNRLWYLNSDKRNAKNDKGMPQTLRLPLWTSLKHVVSSSYLQRMMVMMISCHCAIYLLDGTWHSYLRASANRFSDYQNFNAIVIFWIGLVAFSVSCFSGTFIKKFGWKVTACVAPVVMGVMGCTFFFVSYAKSNIAFLSHYLGPKIDWYLVILGGLQNIVGQTVKLTFYEKTIQIAYIPLDLESRVKGKAAVDMVGSRFGKAVSSWIHLIVLEIFHTSNIQKCSGMLGVILCVVIIFWYRAITYIDKELAVLEKA